MTDRSGEYRVVESMNDKLESKRQGCTEFLILWENFLSMSLSISDFIGPLVDYRLLFR